MSYLLDTCIISKMRKIAHSSNRNLREWILSHHESEYFLSVLTLGEIQYGISKLSTSDTHKKMVLEDWLLNDLTNRFKNRILSIDSDTVTLWGMMRGKEQQQGRNLPIIDSLIAATAKQLNLILVTEHIRDFQNLDVHLLNPCATY